MAKHDRADPFILNHWHVVGALAEMPIGLARQTPLLGEALTVTRTGEQRAEVRFEGRALPVLLRYGYVWTSLGEPPPQLFDIPEYDEPDRRNLNAISVGVHVSAPRAVENFLDMGHFPYVHTGLLGEEPHTEVKDYDVEISTEKDEVMATRCKFYQPKPAAASTSGADVDYVYRVPHPYCSILYKSSPGDDKRLDVICLFLQPADEEHTIAHAMMSVLDSVSSEGDIRRFQQTIFGQDKPILENQFPKRLPLDPRAETPIRADKSAIAYRRWLISKGVTYGTLYPRAA